MMRKLLVGLLVLGAVSSAYAVGLYSTPNVGVVNNYTYANSVAVDASGNAYVSGQVWMDDGSYRGVYWNWNKATKSFAAPYVIPANAGLTISGNAYGIGLLGDGTLVVGGRQPGDGAATWTNAPGAADNGWMVHYISAGNQATTPREQHLIQVKADGSGFYVLGKNSTSSWAGHWDVTGTTQVVDGYGSMSSGATARDISPYGVATGTTKSPVGGDNLVGWNRAFVHDSAGTKLLPLDTAGDQSHGYSISADGNLITGMMRYTGDNLFYGSYWTKSGSTWTAHWLGNLADKSSTGVALATNEAGTIFGGWEYNGANRAVIWDTTVLDEYGQPAAIRLEDYLASYGITDLQGFTRFDKIYDISTKDGVTYISGTGFKGAASTGFLVVVPEPATALFLALGGVALLRRRSR